MGDILLGGWQRAGNGDPPLIKGGIPGPGCFKKKTGDFNKGREFTKEGGGHNKKTTQTLVCKGCHFSAESPLNP